MAVVSVALQAKTLADLISAEKDLFKEEQLSTADCSSIPEHIWRYFSSEVK
jgi:hypothetical protein